MQNLVFWCLIISMAYNPLKLLSHLYPKFSNSLRRAIMLKGSSSITRIFGQHWTAFWLFGRLICLTCLQGIIIGSTPSSSSSTGISLFSRINEKVEPFPSSDSTEIPVEEAGPNVWANLLLWWSPIPVPDLFRSFVYSRVEKSLNRFFLSSCLIPKPVSTTLILMASLSSIEITFATILM